MVHFRAVGGDAGAVRRTNAPTQRKAAEFGTGTTAGGGTSAADELAKLADLHTQGKINDTEYAASQSKVVN